MGGADDAALDVAPDRLVARMTMITPDRGAHRAASQESTPGVKPTLTPRREVETLEYARMMRRMIAAYGRRVADADVEDLAELIALRAEVDQAIAYAVRTSRARHGRSWADIARATGTTRQAAQLRWGKP